MIASTGGLLGGGFGLGAIEVQIQQSAASVYDGMTDGVWWLVVRVKMNGDGKCQNIKLYSEATFDGRPGSSTPRSHPAPPPPVQTPWLNPLIQKRPSVTQC
jgi:hypothetical protein